MAGQAGLLDAEEQLQPTFIVTGATRSRRHKEPWILADAVLRLIPFGVAAVAVAGAVFSAGLLALNLPRQQISATVLRPPEAASTAPEPIAAVNEAWLPPLDQTAAVGAATTTPPTSITAIYDEVPAANLSALPEVVRPIILPAVVAGDRLVPSKTTIIDRHPRAHPRFPRKPQARLEPRRRPCPSGSALRTTHARTPRCGR